MYNTRGLSFCMRITGIALFIFLNTFAAKAYDPKPDPNGEVYVVINIANAKLSQVFELIEKQTSFSFAYDESDINVSKEIRLTKGQQRLEDLLNNISKQAGVRFTTKQNIILVNQELAAVKNMSFNLTAPPVFGVVRDATGNPLAGVTVSVKGTTTAVQTNEEGKFSIDAAANGVLIFTTVGYESVEVPVTEQASLNIVMQPTNKELNEVVVVGYQSRRRGDLSGAVSVVNVGGISKLPVLSVDQALEGKVPGVRITQNTGQPGDGVVVRIRGVGTINDNNPLFIVDGVPTKDGINFLSANDIESIVVLKDASSAAIYGSRAANGVVLITTKSGKRGKPQFNYSGYGGFQSHGTLPKMANTAEYIELYNEAADNDNAGVTNPALDKAKNSRNNKYIKYRLVKSYLSKGPDPKSSIVCKRRQ